MLDKTRVILINNVEYLTVSDFASTINMTTHTVYGLIKKGNRFRKLKITRLAKKPLVYLSELTEFPFSTGGPAKKPLCYHYNKDGFKQNN